MKNLWRDKIFHVLERIQHGALIVQDNQDTYRFGESNAKLTINVTVNNPKIYSLIVWQGTTGAGTGYIDDWWDCTDLNGLFDLLLANFSVFAGIDQGIAKLSIIWYALLHNLRKNNIWRAKSNIHLHYDLGNEFFKQFLDPYMMYSCAIYDNEHPTLDLASANKLKIICEKLKLNAQDHLLEIGTGWGGLALYAHEHYGCKVTTTTVSKAQYDYVKQLIEKKNLTNDIVLLNQDYRVLTGKFDKIVSIEMVEAVGFQFFPDYFKIIDERLKAGGKFLLQAITINDKDYPRAKYEIDFIKKYIFPGGCLPSVAEIHRCIEKYTKLEITHLEDIGSHYVTTLYDWQQRFLEHRQNIIALGFDQSFIRRWEYYFCYCQAGFKHQHISDIQALWTKPGENL